MSTHTVCGIRMQYTLIFSCFIGGCVTVDCVRVVCFLRTVPTTIFSLAMDTTTLPTLFIRFLIYLLFFSVCFFVSFYCLSKPEISRWYLRRWYCNKYIFLCFHYNLICWLRIENSTLHSRVSVWVYVFVCMYKSLRDRWNGTKEKKH